MKEEKIVDSGKRRINTSGTRGDRLARRAARGARGAVTKPPGLHLDFETRSACDLKKAGAYRYAEDPTTDVWCCCYARGRDPVKVWLPGDPFPDEMREQIDEGGQFIAHNYTFERAINLFVMRRHGWPVIPLELWDCTAVRAAAMALPRALDVVARVLRLPERKDNSGKLLMLKMARPVTTEPLTWFDKPEARRTFSGLLCARCCSGAICRRLRTAADRSRARYDDARLYY
jgi:hypothetical protein